MRGPSPVTPRVSVIVPAYNAAEHVVRALDSVARQTYREWELIVVDDGSVDDTARLAEEHPAGAHVVRNRVNRGLAATRNAGLANARGELVALLDSDDAWLPEYLAVQVALYDAEVMVDGPVGIVCCDAYLAGDDGRLSETYGDRFGRPLGAVDAGALLRSNPVFVGALCPRAAIDRAGGFDARLRSVEDLDLWLRIVELGFRVVYNARPLAIYRLGSSTLSRDTLGMTRSRQVVYRKALARGRLTARERAVARRALRLERAAECLELVRRDAHVRPLHAALGAVACAPLLARELIERTMERPRNW